MGGRQNHGPLLGPLNTRCRHNFDNHPHVQRISFSAYLQRTSTTLQIPNKPWSKLLLCSPSSRAQLGFNEDLT